jgi:hypothetical protein
MKYTIEDVKSMLASASDELTRARAFADKAHEIIEEALSMACSLSVESSAEALLREYQQKKGSQN